MIDQPNIVIVILELDFVLCRRELGLLQDLLLQYSIWNNICTKYHGCGSGWVPVFLYIQYHSRQSDYSTLK